MFNSDIKAQEALLYLAKKPIEIGISSILIAEVAAHKVAF